jgi:hypothetical protein
MADILLGNVKGPQGNTGATGSQGPRGDAATITVGTVSTTAYGNTASVTNSGTEQDAVLDFVIPQGKPGEQTTRMGALTLDTITAQSADFPIPAVGETGSTVFGKIIKFFNSTISALNSKLNISDVVNNLTSTSTTQPLSAAQGKALNDALGTLSAETTRITSYFNHFSFAGTGIDSSGLAYLHVPLNFRYAICICRGFVNNVGTVYFSAVCFTNYFGTNIITILDKESTNVLDVTLSVGSSSGHPVLIPKLADRFKNTTFTECDVTVMASYMQ